MELEKAGLTRKKMFSKLKNRIIIRFPYSQHSAIKIITRISVSNEPLTNAVLAGFLYQYVTAFNKYGSSHARENLQSIIDSANAHPQVWIKKMLAQGDKKQAFNYIESILGIS
ncbi:hypothetical protein HER32_12265 [Hymenobacter sp. BT18]|uniref:hypothetical protein n=1 Tax=Hymenobacter sp. BT18 TaxID=2835648 RepID=UPI00143E71A1|nr:hypothetical protein [Hymenobacter sp. BT18]QIX61915.1 hypothetical protein HER32_12265 [Hymenobacter sp. BT18]